MKNNKLNIILLKILEISIILTMLVMLIVMLTKYLRTCKPIEPVTVYINNKAVCEVFGIKQDKCQIEAEYCEEDDYFYDLEKEDKKFRISKNVINLIVFKEDRK
jgi:hypothetical protein